MQVSTTPHFASYDDVLGPRERRYFGDGYKRVNHRLSDIAIGRTSTGDPSYRAAASLAYPADWSKKDCSTLVPHVSSIDTLVLAATICERALLHEHSLSASDAARMWVRRVTVRAGSKPRTDLASVPVTAVREEHVACGEETETTFRFDVGGLRGRIAICHTVDPGGDRPSESDCIGADALKPGQRHFYLDGFKDQTLTASDIFVDDECEHIIVDHRLTRTPPADTEYVGADSAHPDALSVVQGVIGAAQLSQVVLYQLDALSRQNSNTLWMKRIELNAERPEQRADSAFRGVGELRRGSIVEHAARGGGARTSHSTSSVVSRAGARWFTSCPRELMNLRLAVTGAPGTGKTTVSTALSTLLGLPLTDVATIRRDDVEAFAASVELTLRAFERRVHEESQLPRFVSDGSVLHEWACEQALIECPPARRHRARHALSWLGSVPERIVTRGYVGALETIVTRRAAEIYDGFVHLPLAAHARSGVSAHGAAVERALMRAIRATGKPCDVIRGSVASAVDRVVDKYGLEMPAPLPELTEFERKDARG